MEPLIRIYYDSNDCITAAEYEELVGELAIKQLCGTLTKGDVILAGVLHSLSYRYNQIKLGQG